MTQVVAWLVLGLMTLYAFGTTTELAATKHRVEFLAKAKPGFLSIRGKLKEGGLRGNCKSEPQTFQCTGTVRLDDFSTGIGLRDEHMKKRYLETEKFPEATLTVNPFPLPVDWATKDLVVEVPFQGLLTLRGIEKPVAGKSRLEKKSGKAAGTFEFEVLLPDFNIEIPTHLGVTVEKSVQVSIGFEE